VRANQSLFLVAGAPNLDQNPDEKIDISQTNVSAIFFDASRIIDDHVTCFEEFL